MSRISKDYFNDIYKPSHDFIGYGKAKALFKTKMVSDMKHNGEIEDNIMFVEINFDYGEKDIKSKKEKER